MKNSTHRGKGNRRYRKGAQAERDVVNWYRKQGWISARTAGSHGKYDLYAYSPKRREVHLIQVKAGGSYAQKSSVIIPSVTLVTTTVGKSFLRLIKREGVDAVSRWLS